MLLTNNWNSINQTMVFVCQLHLIYTSKMSRIFKDLWIKPTFFPFENVVIYGLIFCYPILYLVFRIHLHTDDNICTTLISSMFQRNLKPRYEALIKENFFKRQNYDRMCLKVILILIVCRFSLFNIHDEHFRLTLLL